MSTWHDRVKCLPILAESANMFLVYKTFIVKPGGLLLSYVYEVARSWKGEPLLHKQNSKGSDDFAAGTVHVGNLHGVERWDFLDTVVAGGTRKSWRILLTPGKPLAIRQ